MAGFGCPPGTADHESALAHVLTLVRPLLSDAEELKSKLIQRVGAVPLMPAERRTFYERVRSTFPADAEGRIAVWILSDRQLKIEKLAGTLRAATLQTVAIALERLRTHLTH